MEALANALQAAQPTVRWFAMSEAMRLHQLSVKALQLFRADPAATANQKAVYAAAEATKQFLMHRGTPEARQHYQTLDQLLYETEKP